MKTMVIIGAGQMGRTAAELLHPNKTKLLAFGDNDPKTWAEDAGQVPVCSVEDAVALAPEQVLVSVLGQERAQDLAQQVRSLGYEGPVLFLKDSYELFDLRSRCIGQLAERIRRLEIPGEVAELGVYRGDTAWQLNALFPDRKLYLFDTFEGFDARDVEREDSPHAKAGRFADTSADAVLARMPYPDQVILRKGYFPETAVFECEVDAPGISGLDGPAFAMVSLDPDLYTTTLEGLRYFYPRISGGGMIVIHDYNNKQFEGVKKAVQDFESEVISKGDPPLRLVPLGDLHGSVVVIK